MPTIEAYRAKTEAELTALLKRIGTRHQRTVLEAVNRYGSVAAVPDTVWEQLKRDIDEESAALAILLLMGVYQSEATTIDQQARRLAPEREPLPVDEITLRRQADTPAKALGRQIANDFIDGARERLAAAVDGEAARLNRLPARQAAAEVRQAVRDALGETRAEGIAITRTTQGISAAQGSAVSDVGRHYGLAIDQAWRTERDANVCPICDALDTRPSIEWVDKFPNGPPAHPRCRCELEAYFPANAN
jgi:hypothetical protein